jgi:hypothetical protein
MKVRNVSPLGRLVNLEIKRGVIGKGDVVDVIDELGERLLEQGDTWAPADAAAEAVLERWKREAPEREAEAGRVAEEREARRARKKAGLPAEGPEALTPGPSPSRRARGAKEAVESPGEPEPDAAA